VELDLASNQLSGSIPDSLGSVANLYYLALFNNQLTGSIPSFVGNLTNLRYLYLNNNLRIPGISATHSGANPATHSGLNPSTLGAKRRWSY
jgi:Leucine-rich repeat (LRR) protein